MHIGLQAKYPLILCDFNGTSIFVTDFRKILIKFHENPSNGSRVDENNTTRGTVLK